MAEKKSVSREFKFVKRDEEKRLVFGIVYSPDEVDSQGDTMGEDEIEKAAHSFAQNGARIFQEHDQLAPAGTVESYIVRSDGYELIPGESSSRIKKGSWVLVVKVTDDALWEAVKSGEVTGFSMGGKGEYADEAAAREAA